MKKTKIFYWIFTILFAALMLFSAIPDILKTQDAVKFMHDFLGYPIYFIPFIGIVKVLGVIAILVPGYPRLKEWAYAGLCFDLIGAFYSVVSVKPGVDNLFMLLFLALAFLSYFFYRKTQKMVLVA
ncbi:MAG: hypothetical protein JWN76_1905 [Chitinophagaceae bacterium]|nr:hypothetical protein [Chitinophagaceae bacterium]